MSMSVVVNPEDKVASRDVFEKAIMLLFITLSWDLRRLMVEEETNKAEAMRTLKKRRDQFVRVISDVLWGQASGVETAFLCLGDTLLAFNGTGVDIQLDSTIIARINNFVVDNVFSAESDSDQTMDQQSQIQLMHKRRNLLAQYCKLIIFGIIDIQNAANVLRYYTKFYTDFGDILKMVVSKCRELDKMGCAKAIVASLCQFYEDMKRETVNHYVDPDSDGFVSLKELAKRLSGVFGSDAKKSRDPIASIHKEGILYALKAEKGARPENVSFLEALMEFSGRLSTQDKVAVLRYLERHGVDVAMEEPYLLYRNSLQERNDDLTSVRSFSTRGRGRGRGRGRPAATPTHSVFGGDD